MKFILKMQTFLLIIFIWSHFWLMLPNFNKLAFFWRPFYSIASKKKLLLPYPSFSLTQEQKSRKKGREWATKKSLKLPSGKPKYLEICLNWPPKNFLLEMVGRNSRIFFINFIICSNFHKYFNFKIFLHFLNKVPYVKFTYFATRGNPCSHICLL